jgi:hypothetical protein
MYGLAADVTALFHLLFILFVVFGAVLGRRSSPWKWLHIACMGYGVLIEVFYWYCPLTYVEQYLRDKAGRGAYSEPFIEHYLNKLIYLDVPQWTLIAAAALVLTLNAGAYLYWWRSQRSAANPSV